MAIKAANVKIYAPLNVLWMYHFMLESPFIENLWFQHFATQPYRFQTNEMLQILEETKNHVKLKKIAEFLVKKDRLSEAANAINARLRAYVDADCFTEADEVLETAPIPLKFVDQTILNKYMNGGHYRTNDFLIEQKSSPAESTSGIEETETLFTANELDDVKSILDIRAEQELNAKMRNLMKINPMIMSQYLNKVADMGNTIVIYDLENHSEVRNSPNINHLYLQALRNGANPKRYIHKIDKLIENASSATNSAQRQQYDEINKIVHIEENLRFLQEHPDAINEC